MKAEIKPSFVPRSVSSFLYPGRNDRPTPDEFHQELTLYVPGEASAGSTSV